jgi:spore maturation protein B
MSQFGAYVVPVVILAIVLCGIIKKQKVFDLFLSGAKEGISIAVNILPALVGLMMAIEMFKASGALDCIVAALAPVGNALHFPSEIVPLALMRPVSGSGSLSVYEGILRTYGADSYIGRVASVLQGSTETTFYTVAIYYGSVSVSKTRHTLPAALSADFIGFIMSIVSVGLILGH